MSFEVSAAAYSRFMGRYSEPLAVKLLALTDVAAGQRALDVGCGPGALTAELIERLGVAAVSAIDPSETFVGAITARFPELDVQRGAAESLPYPDDAFDVALAQLVVHFMADPVAGLSEMARVTRPRGLVAASVWDHASGGSPLSVFWRAVHDLDPQAADESTFPGARRGHLVELFEAAGLQDIEPTMLTVTAGFTSFGEWWEPFTFGVGPAGSYVTGLDATRRDELQARCEALLPPAPFEIEASAWTALGRSAV